MWNVLTVPTVWYFNCPRQCGMLLLFRQCGIITLSVKIPHCRNSKNIPHCRCQLNYHTVGTVITFHSALTIPTVWYFNCPRQCRIFLLFLVCGILIVPHNVECSHCSDSSVPVKLPHCRNSNNIPHCRGELKYHTVGTVKTFHIVGDS
jgi:hypothetical protein